MKFCILVLFCCHFSGGGKCTLYRRAIRYLTCKIFLSAMCTLDETDKHFSHKLLLYFCIFCKMGKKSDLSPECQKFVKKLFAFFSKEKAKKKRRCVSDCMVFKIRVGRSGFFFFLNLQVCSYL